MSRYAVNAFMRLVNMDREALASYVADPRGFVAAWLESNWSRGDQGVLTPEERAALESRDYGALYAMGSHPYLLWSFTEAVWVPEVTRPELVADFKAKAAEAGYPDWRTVPWKELQ